MNSFPTSPRELGRSAWRNKTLIATMIRRDVAGRYRGSFFGILWSVATPILMLLVYTFVFSVVFKARWTSETESREVFALMLFAGLIYYNLFSECITRAPTIIIGNANYVKKVVFPLEIIPFVVLGSALFQFAINLGVWVAACLILTGGAQFTIILLPILIIPLSMLCLGLMWLLGSLGVFLRDVGQAVGIIVSVMMFLSPIFYPVTALPEAYQAILHANPLTLIIESGRSLMFDGVLPDWQPLALLTVYCGLISWLGFAWFQKTRKGFADVL